MLPFDRFISHSFAPSPPLALCSIVIVPFVRLNVFCSATVGFFLEQVALDRGDTIEMRVAARNDSGISILGMKCELIEEAEWTAKGKRSHSRTVLQSVDVPHFVLDTCLVETDLELYGKSQSLQSVSAAAQQQISRVLQAGGGCPLRVLAIPRNASYGFSGGNRHIRLGQLRTYVEVRLVTNKLSRWPWCRHSIAVVPAWHAFVGEGEAKYRETDEGVEDEMVTKIEEPIDMAVADRAAHTISAPFVEAGLRRDQSLSRQ